MPDNLKVEFALIQTGDTHFIKLGPFATADEAKHFGQSLSDMCHLFDAVAPDVESALMAKVKGDGLVN